MNLYCKKNDLLQYACDCPITMYWNGYTCLPRKNYDESCESNYMCKRLPIYDYNVTSLICLQNDLFNSNRSIENGTTLVNKVCL